VDIFDQLKKIEREKLVDVFEALKATDFENIYVDFGAAESEQFPKLFNIDFTLDEFKGFENEMEMQFVFNVVLAGGTSYQSSFTYLKRIAESLKGKFEVYAYVNEFTFRNYAPLIDEVRTFVKNTRGLIKGVKPFGDIYVDRNSGLAITENIKEGRGMADYYSFTSRTVIKREMAKI
jgi:hypothetical protein